MHPFFDPKTLTDDEILKKSHEIMSRLQYAHAFVGDMHMIEQLELLLESLQIERQERMNKQAWDMWQSQFPEVIESDPEFKKSKKAEERKPAAQKERPESAFKRPANPVVFQKEYNPNALKDKRRDSDEPPESQGS